MTPRYFFRALPLSLLAALVLLPSIPKSVGAQAYAYTKIAGTGPGSSFYQIGNFTGPSINASGTVSFTADTIGSNGNGVFTGDGKTLTTIVNTVGGSTYGVVYKQATSINAAGVVAFQGQGNGYPNDGVYASDGKSLIKIAPAFDSGTYGPSINNSATVAFPWTKPGSGVRGTYRSDGGAITTIAENVPPFGLTAISGSSLNDSGTVAFAATEYLNVGGVYTGSGGTLNTIAVGHGFATSEELASSYQHFAPPVINAGNDVAFSATLVSGGAGVYLVHDGRTTTIADSAGGFSVFDGSYSVGGKSGIPPGFLASATALNNIGEVAFGAATKTGDYGIYTGSDPLADKVIGGNDALDGSTVQGIGFYQDGLNSTGQIAFFAYLADGREEIFRADPVSEASTILSFGLPLALGLGAVTIMSRGKKAT